MLLAHVKNYRSANLLACDWFISDLLPWKRTGLARVGDETIKIQKKKKKGKVPRQSRMAKVRAAEDCGGEAVWPESQESTTSESFVLKTYIVVGIGVKRLHID